MSNASIRSGFFRYSGRLKLRALEKTKALFDILLRFIGGQSSGHGQRIAVVIGRQDEHPGLVVGLFNASQASCRQPSDLKLMANGSSPRLGLPRPV